MSCGDISTVKMPLVVGVQLPALVEFAHTCTHTNTQDCLHPQIHRITMWQEICQGSLKAPCESVHNTSCWIRRHRLRL